MIVHLIFFTFIQARGGRLKTSAEPFFKDDQVTSIIYPYKLYMSAVMREEKDVPKQSQTGNFCVVVIFIMTTLNSCKIIRL